METWPLFSHRVGRPLKTSVVKLKKKVIFSHGNVVSIDNDFPLLSITTEGHVFERRLCFRRAELKSFAQTCLLRTNISHNLWNMK